MPGDPLYGRAAELERAASGLDAVARGEHRLLLALGEAGIGKTRLLAEVASQARADGFVVLEGRATELERAAPLLPVLDAIEPHLAGLDLGAELAPDRLALLAGVLPGLGGGQAQEDSGGERWRLYRALAELLPLIGRGRPLLILIDDVHWSDPATEELLAHLIRRPPCDSLLIALGLRPSPAAERLRVAERASSAIGLVDIELWPLRRSSAEPLLAEIADAAERDRLFAASGGNPLLLGELVRGGGRAEIPSGIVAAVQAEVEGLTPDARALLEAAAVAGDPFDLDLASAVAELSGGDALAALDLLADRQLIRAGNRPRQFCFRHPVVRSAIHEGLGAGALLALHAATAAELERIDAPLPAQARHLAHTASPGDTKAAATLAGAAAAVRSQAPEVAADWLLAARRAAPGEVELTVLVETLVEAGRLTEALDAIDRGASGGEAASLALAGASIERLLGRHEAAQGRLLRAHSGAESDPAARARIAADLAVAAYQRGEYMEIGEWAQRIGPESTAGAVSAVVAILRTIGNVFAGNSEAGAGELDGALEALERADDEQLAELAEPAMALSWGLLALERLPEGLATAQRIAAAATRAGNPLASLTHQFAAVLALGLLGRMSEAEPLADEAEQAARVSGVAPLLQWILWLRGWVLMERGDLDAALDAVQESVELAAEMDDSASTVVARTVFGAVLGARGEPERARELLAAYELDSGWICRWAPFLVESDLAAGDLEAAQTHAERAASLAPETGMAGARAASARAQALATLADDRPEAAAQFALRAIEEAEEAGTMLEAARARLVAGRALVRGDRQAGIEQLKAAARGGADCGARRVEDEARRELRRAGVRLGRGGPRAPGSEGLDALSPRELEIAQLVGEGLTNREIGARLFLSEKTIETHLTHVFQKLGLRSRTQVAAMVANT
jgi:DNA-binding NarL/FixJ family response regulator